MIYVDVQFKSYYEIKVEYKNGEYGHSLDGILQGYCDILRVEKPLVVFDMLYLKSINKLKLRASDI